MGEYFKLVNKTKKEFIEAYDLEGKTGTINWYGLPYLCQFLAILLRYDWKSGGPCREKNHEGNVWGHWSHDEICITGDYGGSGLYDEAEEDNGWTNISKSVGKAFRELYDEEHYKAP